MGKTTNPATFSFTEETNALDYLEEVCRFLKRTASHPCAWKWVTIALHGALYGFAVAACRGTTNDRVLKPTKSGREQLLSIGDALNLCQDRAVMGRLTIGRPLVLTAEEKRSLHELTRVFRNRFEHHIPSDWTFFVADFPPMCRDVVDVIRRLARETRDVCLLQRQEYDIAAA